ncbi:MAG: hypothetical protein ACRDSE_24465, partial [Pseudonocardiaceae bacterium]
LPDPAEAARADAMRSRMATWLKTLPRNERDVLEAVVFEGDGLIETATRLGEPVDVAAAQLSSALRRLTTLLST